MLLETGVLLLKAAFSNFSAPGEDLQVTMATLRRFQVALAELTQLVALAVINRNQRAGSASTRLVLPLLEPEVSPLCLPQEVAS